MVDTVMVVSSLANGNMQSFKPKSIQMHIPLVSTTGLLHHSLAQIQNLAKLENF